MQAEDEFSSTKSRGEEHFGVVRVGSGRRLAAIQPRDLMGKLVGDDNRKRENQKEGI
jgi:hypothetical protein